MSKDGSLTVPSGAFSFTMKPKALGGDHYDAMEAMRGERDRHGGNTRLAYAIYSRYLAAFLITSWDRTHMVEVTDRDGLVSLETQQLPVTVETVASIEDHDDYEYVIGQAIARVQLRDAQAEQGFKKPSTPSSRAGSSMKRRSRNSG